MNAIYLALDFDPEGCGRDTVSFHVGYDTVSEYNDYSRDLRFPLDRPIRVFLPAYRGAGYRFESIAFEEHAESCLIAAGKVQPSASPPLMLDIAVPRNAAEIEGIPRRRFK